MVKTKTKRILVLMLTFLMVATNVLPSLVVAENEGTTVEDPQKIEAVVEESTEVEDPSLVVTEVDEVVLEDQVEEDVTLETEEAEENAPPTEEVIEEPVEEKPEEPAEEAISEEVQEEPIVEELIVDEKLVSDLDFSSGRLIVKGDVSFTEEDPVIASMDGVHILQYETEEHAKAAYTHFVEEGVQVEVDAVFSISDETILVNGEETEVTPVDEVMTEESNPFTEAEAVKTDKIKYDVAVIDTGANNADKVVSVLGDDGADKNGHGQKMIDTIKEIAPEAKVLSIKALGDNGKGDVSAVYAAIKLAIEEDVKIINLSISAKSNSDNLIIEEAIELAISNGIIVVGAAGNNGIDASLTIPGRIENAIIVGTTQKNSNTGSTVDYTLEVSSTSIAAATVSALLASNTLDNYQIVDGILILNTPNQDGNTTEPTESTDEFEAQAGGGAGGTSGGGGAGSVAGVYGGRTYIWYDRGVYTEDGANKGKAKGGQPNYPINGSASAKNQAIDESVKFFKNLLEGRNDKGNTLYGRTLLPWAQSSNRLYNDESGTLRRAIKIAIENAVRRDPSAQYVRVIGVGFTWNDGGQGNNQWQIGNSVYNSGYSGGKYYNHTFQNVVKAPSGTQLPHTVSGLEIGWGLKGKNIADKPQDWNKAAKKIGADPNEMTWRQYVYGLGLIDATNKYHEWEVYAIAVTENWPSSGPSEISIKKSSWDIDTLNRSAISYNNAYRTYLGGAIYTLKCGTSTRYLQTGSTGIVHNAKRVAKNTILENATKIETLANPDAAINQLNLDTLEADKVGLLTIEYNGETYFGSVHGNYFYLSKSGDSSIEIDAENVNENHILEEIYAPASGLFLKSSGTYSFKPSETQEITIDETDILNDQPIGVYLTKSVNNGEWDPDKDLIGALYFIYTEDGQTIGRFLTDNWGWGTAVNGVYSEDSWQEVKNQFDYDEEAGIWVSNDNYEGNDDAIVVKHKKSYYLTNGTQYFRLLKPGRYYLKELAPPASGQFKLNKSIDWFTLKEDGTIVTDYGETTDGELTYELAPSLLDADIPPVKIKKSSSNEKVLNSSLYSLKGTTYKLYLDEACTEPAIDYETNTPAVWVVEDEEGNSNTVHLASETTYYYKETKAGKGYKLDTTVHNFTITLEELPEDPEEPVVITVEDDPKFDEVSVKIRKISADKSEPIKYGTAIFKLERFDNVNNNTSGRATDKWFFTTKSSDEGISTELKDAYLLANYKGESSSEYYTNNIRTMELPLGTYKLTEVEAPKKYKISDVDSTTFVIKEDGNSVVKTMYGNTVFNHTLLPGEIDEYSVINKEIKGGVYIEKVDKYKGDSEPAGDADLKDIEVTIKYTPTTETDTTVVVDDVEYSSNDIVKTLKVKEGTRTINGASVKYYYATTDTNLDNVDRTLPSGEYTLYESKTNDSYVLTDTGERKFTIGPNPEDDGVVVKITNSLANNPRQGYIQAKKLLEETQEIKHGDAKVDDIRFAIVNRSIKPIVINRGQSNEKKILTGRVADIVTIGSNGLSNKSTALDYGTYEIIELRKDAEDTSSMIGKSWEDVNKGTSIYSNEYGVLYKDNTDTTTIRVEGETKQVGDRQFESENTYMNNTAYGGVNVQKINEELMAVQNSGDTWFAGNTFNIVNASIADVVVEGVRYGKVADRDSSENSWTESSVKVATNITRAELINAKNAVGGNGAVVKTLTTNDEGFAETDLNTLPYGTYYIYEATTNPSWEVSQTVLRVEIREDKKMVDTTPEFGASLTLPNKNDTEVTFPQPLVRGDLLFTKVDEDGKRRPNTPFLIAALDKDGKIIESHVIVTDSSGMASTTYIYDTVEQDNMLETTQRERKHSENTNKFDKYVKKNADGSYSVTAEGEALLASGEASTYGVWFSQGLDVNTGKIVKNSKATPDDSRGALYYGTYQIFEIQCEENKNLGEDLLISDKFTIRNKTTVLNSEGDVIEESDKNIKDAQLRYSTTFVDLEVLITSKAVDVITDSQVTFANQVVELTDTISFSNIKATSTYKWVVEYCDTETGEVLSTVEIDKFVPETTNNAVNTTNQPKPSFTVSTAGTISPATNPDGTVNKGYQGEPIVTSTGNVDTTGLDGKSISVTVSLYEYITGYDFDNEDDYKEFTALNFIKSHNIERNDENQKIYIPKMETTAIDIFTKDHVGTKYNIGENYDDISKTDAIIDTVTVNNLSPREKYMLVEYLWDATEGKRYSDEQISYTWYSDRDPVNHIEEWIFEMEPFEVDSKDFADKTLVVMEELWRVDNNGNKIDPFPVITHEDVVDENQSVHYIDISTQLIDEFTEDHVGTVTEKVTLTDTVTLKNLVKDMKYTIKGELVYQKDCTDVNGVEHKAGDLVEILPESVTEVEYTATEYGDASVEITYVVDSRVLEGISVVSTEYAYHNDVLIDKHVDLEDEFQTVVFPKIRTKAADGKTGDDVGTIMEDGTLIDTVQLWNLIEGEEYTVSGTLVYQEDGTPVEGVSTTPVTFTATAEQTEYTEVEIKFTGIDATKLAGKTVVVFEKLYHPNENTGESVEVNRHEDLTDKAQTVHFPSISTKAVDKRTGDQVGSIFGKAINKIRQFFGGNVVDDDQIEIVDTVILGNLVPGRTYTINGVLMDQDTNELLTGKEITATATITVGEGTITGTNGEKTTVTKYDKDLNHVNGTVELTFRLGTEEITDKTVVVFEKLMHNDVEVNRHEDINDRAQFVNLIDVDSTAIDANTGNHVGDVPGSTLDTAKIVETFNMRKLVNGEDYKVDFALLVREESEKQGKPIYLAKDGTFTENREEAINSILDMTALAEKEASGWKVIVNGEELFVGETQDEAQAFYADYLAGLTEEEKANAEAYLIEKFNEMVPDEDAFSAGAQMVVEFEIDKDTVAGYTIVVVTDVYHKDVMIATHSDMYNEDESVHYPKIETEATDEQTKEHVGVMGEKTVIIDKVYYENLLADHEYEITGFLMDKETGEKYLDADNKEVYGTTGTFTIAEGEETGYKEVRFEFNGANLEGKTIVVFEDLHHNGVNIERHYDIEDENQTVHYPSIRTRAFNRLTGTQLLKKDEPAIISDTIYYENLVPGLEYIITGTIYDVETGKEIEGIVGQTKITPTEFNNSGEVTIEFDANALAGKAYVFKEVLSIMVPNTDGEEEEVTIFTHFDINDLDETFYIPEIGTVAVSNRNEKFIATEDKQVIVDTISYKGMKPGSTNIAVLTVFDKTLDRVLTEIEPVKKEFIADESGIGTVEVTVTVNGAEYAGHDLVMFEEVYTKPDDIETPARDWEKYPIAEHKDKDDESQTIHVPKIETNAALADTEEDITTNMTRIKDTVTYTNLIPGVEYTLEARGINPETGKATVNEKGEEYVFTKTFTPTEPNGEVEVEMVFKQSDIIGTQIVAFEKLFVEYGLEGQFEVTNHEDPTDENQTVELYQSVKITVIKKSAGVMLPLKGAEISIFNSKDEVIKDRFGKDCVGITDEEGKVTFEILAYKNETYYAKETKAPAGYHSNPAKFELVRDENGNLKAEIDIEILDNLLIIPPTPVKTGDETNIALWALLLTLSLLGVAIVQKRRLSVE
jgi:hypothetical protein